MVAAAGKSEFGLYGVVGGMAVIELLADPFVPRGGRIPLQGYCR